MSPFPTQLQYYAIKLLYALGDIFGECQPLLGLSQWSHLVSQFEPYAHIIHALDIFWMSVSILPLWMDINKCRPFNWPIRSQETNMRYNENIVQSNQFNYWNEIHVWYERHYRTHPPCRLFQTEGQKSKSFSIVQFAAFWFHLAAFTYIRYPVDSTFKCSE